MDDSVTGSRFERWSGWITAVFYLLILASLSTSVDLQTQLIGNNIDNWIFYWNNWWLRTAMAEGISPFFTDRMFAPNGTSLALHSFSYTTSLLVWLVAPFRGPVFAHNFVLFFRLWLGGMGMFVLVRAHTGRASGAFLAGLIYFLAPYHITQILAHDHLGSIQWWPWFIWMLGNLLKTSQWRYAVGAGILAALTLWGGLQLTVLLAMLTLFYLLIQWRMIIETPKNMGLLSTVGVVALLLSSPYLIQLFNARADIVSATSVFQESGAKQTDLFAYFVPPTYHPLWGEVYRPIYESFIVNRAFMPYLGYLPIFIALLGALRVKQVRVWLIALFIWIMLALGDSLRINGTVTDLTLPFNWLSPVFPFSTLRSPDRINLLVVFTLAFIVGIAFSGLIKQKYALWLALATLGILAEFVVWPLPAWDLPASSPIIETIRAENFDQAIFDYPPGYTNAKRWLYYQTLHEQPTVDGHLSRFTPETYQTIIGTQLGRSLYLGAEQPPNLTIPAPESEPSAVEFLDKNIRYVIHHRDYSTEQEAVQLYALLPHAPIYKDEVLEIFDLTQPDPFMLVPESGQHDIGSLFGESFLLQTLSWRRVGSVLTMDLGWSALAETNETYKVFVHLINEEGQLVAQYDAVPCRWGCPTDTWQPNTPINDFAAIELYGLPSGNYDLHIGLYNEVPLQTENGETFAKLSDFQIVIK